MTGALVGVVSAVSLFLTLKQSPVRLRHLTLKYPLITDITAAVIIWMGLSFVSASAVSAIAAAVASLLISAGLAAARNFEAVRALYLID